MAEKDLNIGVKEKGLVLDNLIPMLLLAHNSLELL